MTKTPLLDPTQFFLTQLAGVARLRLRHPKPDATPRRLKRRQLGGQKFHRLLQRSSLGCWMSMHTLLQQPSLFAPS
jgi:hypothetical protein